MCQPLVQCTRWTRVAVAQTTSVLCRRELILENSRRGEWDKTRWDGPLRLSNTCLYRPLCRFFFELYQGQNIHIDKLAMKRWGFEERLVSEQTGLLHPTADVSGQMELRSIREALAKLLTGQTHHRSPPLLALRPATRSGACQEIAHDGTNECRSVKFGAGSLKPLDRTGSERLMSSPPTVAFHIPEAFQLQQF